MESGGGGTKSGFPHLSFGLCHAPPAAAATSFRPYGATGTSPGQSESARPALGCEQPAILGVIEPRIDYPEGTKSFSPRLRGTSYLGSSNNRFINPETG